jgi:hypothetical protein
VAELLDPSFVGTIFAPINSGFNDDRRQLAANTGVSLVESLQSSPTAAASVVKNAVITGQALQFTQLQ